MSEAAALLRHTVEIQDRARQAELFGEAIAFAGSLLMARYPVETCEIDVAIQGGVLKPGKDNNRVSVRTGWEGEKLMPKAGLDLAGTYTDGQTSLTHSVTYYQDGVQHSNRWAIGPPEAERESEYPIFLSPCGGGEIVADFAADSLAIYAKWAQATRSKTIQLPKKYQYLNAVGIGNNEAHVRFGERTLVPAIGATLQLIGNKIVLGSKTDGVSDVRLKIDMGSARVGNVKGAEIPQLIEISARDYDQNTTEHFRFSAVRAVIASAAVVSCSAESISGIGQGVESSSTMALGQYGDTTNVYTQGSGDWLRLAHDFKRNLIKYTAMRAAAAIATSPDKM